MSRRSLLVISAGICLVAILGTVLAYDWHKNRRRAVLLERYVELRRRRMFAPGIAVSITYVDREEAERQMRELKASHRRRLARMDAELSAIKAEFAAIADTWLLTSNRGELARLERKE